MVADASEENRLIEKGYNLIAGVDETGMGSLAGNVYVSAVILPPNIDYKKELPGLNDSKKKTHEQRLKLYDLIKKVAISYSVQIATIEEIEIHNIYWARFIAAKRALDDLSVKPNYVLMDGNAEIPDIDVPQEALIKGDSRSISIAAASILAKVDRDAYMAGLATLVNKDYGWLTNKAYYSKSHIDALKKHGKTEWHRYKFVKKFLENG